MLTANELHIEGRRHTLLPSTTLEASRGEVTLVQADGQERRTALALALTGRMKPSSGTVALGHSESLAALRHRSVIVDSPEVNAPEHHLTVRSLVSEDLALVPLKFRDRTRPTAWLVNHGFRDVLDKWVEELEPERLLHLQLELALADQFVELVVVDSPDRHTADPSGWLTLLEHTAAGKIGQVTDSPADTPARQLVVVVVVGRIPDGWNGPAFLAGDEPEQHHLESEPSEGEAAESAPLEPELADVGPEDETEAATGPKGEAEPELTPKPDPYPNAAPEPQLDPAPETASETEITGEEGGDK
ncbi:ABC transporter ATP-binding protein [Arthrobacter cryoconiti]|uniref:ABC transporter ATP-binding protein n=1 Tax=Arthrobacter cryoconiti TaxID=748907 RepID=A0ABV8QXV8_9MICC|nr:ABC transporter ATP-binding protein [Arthrobacter cryoconiti]MCC9067704.1 ABC transporter ATP-binding protein [Arthrobacter cryoconiti]